MEEKEWNCMKLEKKRVNAWLQSETHKNHTECVKVSLDIILTQNIPKLEHGQNVIKLGAYLGG